MNLVAAVDKAKTMLQAQIVYKDKITTINSDFRVENYPLAKLQPYLLTRVKPLKQLAGSVSLNIVPHIVLSEDTLKLDVAKTEVSLANIKAVLQLDDKSGNNANSNINEDKIPHKAHQKSTVKNYSLAITDIQSDLNNVTTVINFKQKEASPSISVGDITIRTKQAISFTDHNIDPSVTRTLFIDKIAVGALSTLKTEQITPFEIHLRSNEYAKINFAGDLKPFSKIPEYHLKGDIKEISLPSISPYLEQSMQLSLQSGQLNTGVKAVLIKDKIKANIDIRIKGLKTADVDTTEIDLLKNNTSLPLNTALDLLKDSKGNVKLNVPLSGSINDPKFGLNSIVSLITQKAVMSASKYYFMKTFVPYANVVSLAMSAGDFILKVRFEDLIYQVKQLKPNDKQIQYLKQFIALMNDKPDVNVKICAISVPADIDLAAGRKVTKKANITKLIALAKKREHNFKDYILQHSKIDSSRLLLCAPKIDSDKTAKPKISLSV